MINIIRSIDDVDQQTGVCIYSSVPVQANVLNLSVSVRRLHLTVAARPLAFFTWGMPAAV